MPRRRMSAIGRDIRYAAAMPLHSQAELGERSANLAESCDDLPGRREQEEFARVAGAVLQQRRGRIATGVDLYRVDGEACGLDVIAGLLLPRVDRGLARIPAVLCIETVSQQDNDRLVFVVRIDRRHSEGR